MKVSERLQKRILDDLDIAVEAPTRIQRGVHGRASGQFAWCAKYKGYAGGIGSEDTMVQCLKANKLGIYKDLSTGQIHVCAD